MYIYSAQLLLQKSKDGRTKHRACLHPHLCSVHEIDAHLIKSEAQLLVGLCLGVLLAPAKVPVPDYSAL